MVSTLATKGTVPFRAWHALEHLHTSGNAALARSPPSRCCSSLTISIAANSGSPVRPRGTSKLLRHSCVDPQCFCASRSADLRENPSENGLGEWCSEHCPPLGFHVPITFQQKAFFGPLFTPKRLK